MTLGKSVIDLGNFSQFSALVVVDWVWLIGEMVVSELREKRLWKAVKASKNGTDCHQLVIFGSKSL